MTTMKNVVLEMGWRNNPLSTDGNPVPINLSTVPFGVIVAAPNGNTGGGGNFNFKVEKLDMSAYAAVAPSTLGMTFGPDNQIIEGDEIIGKAGVPLIPNPQYNHIELLHEDGDRWLLEQGQDGNFKVIEDFYDLEVEIGKGHQARLRMNLNQFEIGKTYFIETTDLNGYLDLSFFSTVENGSYLGAVLELSGVNFSYREDSTGFNQSQYIDSVDGKFRLFFEVNQSGFRIIRANESLVQPPININLIDEDILEIAMLQADSLVDRTIMIGHSDAVNINFADRLTSIFLPLSQGKITLTLDNGACVLKMLSAPPSAPLIISPPSNGNWNEIPSDMILFAFFYQEDALNIMFVKDASSNYSRGKINSDRKLIIEHINGKFLFKNSTGDLIIEYLDRSCSYLQLGNIAQNSFIYMKSLNYDLSEAIVDNGYALPDNINDGVYYELESSVANLLGKYAKAGDFIQFYNDKTGVIVYRQ